MQNLAVLPSLPPGANARRAAARAAHRPQRRSPRGRSCREAQHAVAERRHEPDLLPARPRSWMQAVEITFRCGPTRPPRFDAPESLLDALARVGIRCHASAGLGREMLLEGPGLSGRALVVGEEVVHQVALAR